MMTPHAANVLRTCIRATKTLRSCPWHLSGEINTTSFHERRRRVALCIFIGLAFPSSQFTE